MNVAVDCPDASVASKVEIDYHEGDCQEGAVMRGHAVMRGTFNECLPVLRALGVQEQAQKWCGAKRMWVGATRKRDRRGK